MHRAFAALVLLTILVPWPAAAGRFPSILLVTVDTLRADRLSVYGYNVSTSPNIDRLLDEGVRFAEARAIEPLTTPSVASMLTSIYPHEHGASRNGLRVRPGLESVSGVLGRRGFATAAFVGNWTLKDHLSGFGEHFEEYTEVMSRKRWLFIKGEATAADLTFEALEWLEEHVEDHPGQPFFLWVHYVEPHAPYRAQEEVLADLGLDRADGLTRSQRYDSEIAFVDRSIGRLVREAEDLVPRGELLVAFTSDHGESLGEHGYWGHGRHLYETGLRIPLGIRWPGRLEPGVVEGPALNLDIAPTILGLIGYPIPEEFRGFDWSGVLRGEEDPPIHRATFYQAHKGAVQAVEEASKARRRGLLELGLVYGSRKEILDLRTGRLVFYDLAADPAELHPEVVPTEDRETIEKWSDRVARGLEAADRLPPPEVDAETEERMRALGYLD